MNPPVRSHRCPVCGFNGLMEAPRTPSGGGSYEICPCCGYQFGVDDDDRRVSHAAHRERWIAGGMQWWSRGIPAPAHWNPRQQLADLASED